MQILFSEMYAKTKELAPVGGGRVGGPGWARWDPSANVTIETSVEL